MKKKIFMVSALVAMAMSVMFISCNSKNEAENGCTCSYSFPGEATQVLALTFFEMKEQYGVTDCTSLANVIKTQNESNRIKISCSGY